MPREKTTAKSLANAFHYLSEAEVDALNTLANQTIGKRAVIVNVGAGTGTSSLAIAEGNEKAERYTVEVQQKSPVGGLTNEKNAFKESGYALPNQILGKSHDVARDWPPSRKIDLIFIDDGHHERHIRGDIELWLPHMRDGGVMAFHDYGSPKWPAVKQVVDELMEPYMQILFIDSVIAFRIVHVHPSIPPSVFRKEM